jgi:two-component system sensor histidine kinase KdpD
MSGPRPRLLAVGASCAAIALVTLVIYALRPVVPVVSLGVLYTLAVLPVAMLWGLPYAIGVSLVSMLAFNFLFLPPVHTFAIEDSRNWGALAVYLVTAVVVSELAASARRRAAEAERLAREAFEAESLRRSDAVKTAIIQAVSHDLRTPLATMEAAVGGLESGVLELSADDRASLLETLRIELARLTRLVENLLDLSRLQAGAAEPYLELWTADQLLAQALEEVADSTRVIVSAPPDLPLVRVDAAQVQRVLVNLIENALKFSPPDEAVVVSAAALDGELILRIDDRGGGVARDELERVFEPFHRSSGGPGAGLGLAIARGFAVANDGRLWSERREGGGASFSLALPVAEALAPVPS